MEKEAKNLPYTSPWGWWGCLWWLVLTLLLTTSALLAITIPWAVDDELRSNIRMRSSVNQLYFMWHGLVYFSWSRLSDVWASISFDYSHDSIRCGDCYGAYFDDVSHGYMWLILLMFIPDIVTHYLQIWTSFRYIWLLVITIMLYYPGYVTFLWSHIMVVGSSYWILSYTY